MFSEFFYKFIQLYFTCLFLLQTTVGQCFGREPIHGAGFPSPISGRPFDGYTPFDGFGSAWPSTGCGMGPIAQQPGLAASYGGGLSVTSSSPISPTGLTVTSENEIEGTVTVAGQLPFLGAVATDGAFATAGAGAVSYGCGDGTIGIVAETPITPVSTGYSAGVSPYNYGTAMSGFKGFSPVGGCGCGALY